ncbi:hypothetical protein OBBRIDRAFT_739817 [Obba rivulosa]|uniref:Uncharacterized protein n=1 Tax=Obba rivulosa TaxID=1052685 RepID=A0A8E2DG16_9APHY|nr:hypothetical protein OBBRIDRAFT_739817 [Obba rivulosa]
MFFVDTPLSYEALTAPDLTYTLIRPLQDKYNAIQRQGNFAVVFCLLINRVYFFRDHQLSTAALSSTRATLCEILAISTLREYADSVLNLALAITTVWPVYAGAPDGLIQRAREQRADEVQDRVGNAIELAIISQAKRFIKSPACQKVIDGIWSGRIVYTAESSRSILSDTYKRSPIHFYNPRKAPLLDHYRLKVPAIRSVLEYSNFVILFILFILALEYNEKESINIVECIFMLYALGFTLEKIAAMQEHGIKVYFKGTWNGFDMAFISLYCTYVLFRLYGVYHDGHWALDAGIDFLAVVAVLMFPRLAFVTLKDSVLVLSLRAMIMQFVVLMFIAAFCFGGFLYALWTYVYLIIMQIAWWMLDLWFGLDASLFENAPAFHAIWGPVMIVTYACLSNTLLLTGKQSSILSHTFSTINEDAAAEAMFRRAVLTIEGVKADSLFSYQPPVNVLALCIMLPASYVLSPRWFHKVNVFVIRLTNFPILLLISFYERQVHKSGAFTFYETVSSAAEKLFDALPRPLKRLSFFEGLSGSEADIDAIFELEEQCDEYDTRAWTEERPGPTAIDIRQRRLSSASQRPSQSHLQTYGGAPPGAADTSQPSVSPQKTEQGGPASPPRAPSISQPSGGPASPPRTPSTSQPWVPSQRTEQGGPASPPREGVQYQRRRLNSVVNRTVDIAASPLAQVFLPWAIGEVLPAEEQQTQNGQMQFPQYPPQDSHAPGMVSYGPASRRRMSSMHHRPPSDGENSNSQRQLFHLSPSARSVVLDTQPLTESPDERAEQSTAQQVEDEHRRDGDTVERRLDQIEGRQKRIEELLKQLVAAHG